jgi:xylulokinase
VTYLGLDLGTSSVKALLIDADQAVLAEASAPIPSHHPHPLWVEQNPEDWWAAAETALHAVREAAPGRWAALVGIGLSGQMHGATLLDAADQVLRPTILWNDGRWAAECTELHRRVPDLSMRTGNIAMTGFTAPKLLWVAKHESAIFARTRTVLLPKDWLRLRLTGERVSMCCPPDRANCRAWRPPG